MPSGLRHRNVAVHVTSGNIWHCFCQPRWQKSCDSLMNICQRKTGRQYLMLANLQILQVVWFPKNLHLNQPHEERDLPVQPTTFHLRFNASDFHARPLYRCDWIWLNVAPWYWPKPSKTQYQSMPEMDVPHGSTWYKMIALSLKSLVKSPGKPSQLCDQR